MRCLGHTRSYSIGTARGADHCVYSITRAKTWTGDQSVSRKWLETSRVRSPLRSQTVVRDVFNPPRSSIDASNDDPRNMMQRYNRTLRYHHSSSHRLFLVENRISYCCQDRFGIHLAYLLAGYAIQSILGNNRCMKIRFDGHSCDKHIEGVPRLLMDLRVR